jgi:hydroxyacylglutathione hydrolase
LIIEKMPVGPLETNCYLIAGDEGGPGAVIDPGDYADQILAVAERLGINIEKIIVTHGHWDHIGALADLANLTGAEVLVHKKDAEYLTDPDKNLSGLVFARRERRADRSVEDGDIIKIGDLDLRVIHTPGHTPGSMSILVENNLFCGDLIFFGSIGRTDLPGGSRDEMHHSLHAKAMMLPDETNIYPGHGPVTTVGREREENPYISNGW